MEYSDDKTNRDGKLDTVDTEQTSSVNDDADRIVARSDGDEGAVGQKTVETGKASERSGSAGELAALSIKAIAVAMSVVILFTCILAVALPLAAMRIFNKLGMSARAVDFGERYIAVQLDEYGAGGSDAKGNMLKLSHTPALTNDDFIEALYVCNNLSYRLMEDAYAANDAVRGEYYAERLEKYTRMYLSLNNVGVVNSKKSAQNVSSMPSIALRPMVYSYGHDMRVMNFRARARLGKTTYAMYDSRSNDAGTVTELATLSNTFNGLVLNGASRPAIMAALDDYVDFVGQIGEYLDVCFLRAGVENDLSKRVRVAGIDGVSVVSELFVSETYYNVFKGDEFPLFIDSVNGFTNLYKQLKQRFNDYAQAAVDFKPSDGNNNKLDEQLHQLYWLQALASAARRLHYAEMLLYYNSDMFGIHAQAIRDDYPSWQGEITVEHNGQQRQISEVYADKLIEYIKQYQS